MRAEPVVPVEPVLTGGSTPADGTSSTAASMAQLLPGLASIAVFLTWAKITGGYFPHVWYAGGLFLAGLLLVLLLARPGLFETLGRPTSLALLAFALFTAWSYLSISWADVRGDAWDGANRTALYLIVFALFALWPLTSSQALVLLGAFALGTCLLGVSTLTGAARESDAGSYFIDARFTDPIGYVNGNAALFLLAFWPALFLASRRELPTFVRPVFLAAAGVLLELAVLPQSRGAAASFALVLLVYLALVPGRVRSFVFLLPVGLAVAVAFQRLLDVGSDGDGAALAAGARSALETLGVTTASLLAVGFALAVLDRRMDVSQRSERFAARILGASAALVVVAGTAVMLSSVDIGARAGSAWEQFNSEAPPPTSSGYLLSGVQTSRPDMWRVASSEFQAHPLRGIGAENFSVAYLRKRRLDEESLYPHSLPLQVLLQTGLVGAALMALFLAAALAAALKARHRRLARGLSAVAIVMFLSWFVHGSIDWFWELPALAAPALAALAMAASTGRPLPQSSGRSTRLLGAGAVVLTLSVAVSFVFPWLSARETRVSISAWRVDPARALAGLERARKLNPLTDRPDLAAGSIARRRRDWDAMAAAYERALERNALSWYSHLQLALARARQGDRAAARTEIASARRLNPREPVLGIVSGWLERGEPVRVAAIANILLERHERETT